MSDHSDDSDKTCQLLEQARDGDQHAFQQLFDRHRSDLQRLVELRLDSRVRARVDPGDIVQETYLEAYRRLDHYLTEPPLPFRLWLRQIAYDRIRKACRKHVTSKKRDVTRDVPLPEQSSLALAQKLLAKGSTPSEKLSRRELVQRVRQALAELSETDREILMMRHFEGLSNDDVSQLLSLTASAVSKRHARAMVRLHKLLFNDGISESEL